MSLSVSIAGKTLAPARRWSVSALCLCLLLHGCAVDFKPRQPATVILDNAHVSGTAVAFSTDSTLLASGGFEGDIQFLSVADGKAGARFHAHRGAVNGIGFLDATQMVSAGYDGRIAIWHTSGKLLQEMRTPSPISHMVVDAQYQRIVTGHKDGAVRVWRLPGLVLESEHRPHSSEVRSIAWHAASGQLASSGNDGRVFAWSATTTPVELDKAPSDAANLQFSPDGRTLMGGGWFKLLRWDIASRALEVIPTEHHGLINSLRYTLDGKALATVSRHTDSAVYFLDAQSGAVLRRFQAHDLCGADIALSPDNRYLATTSDDTSVRLWDLHLSPPRR
jgi:WD40 repeat protein